MYARDESSSLIMQRRLWEKIKFYDIDYDCQLNETFSLETCKIRLCWKCMPEMNALA